MQAAASPFVCRYPGIPLSMRLADGDKLTVKGLALDVIYSPGHTDDSYSFNDPAVQRSGIDPSDAVRSLSRMACQDASAGHRGSTLALHSIPPSSHNCRNYRDTLHNLRNNSQGLTYDDSREPLRAWLPAAGAVPSRHSAVAPSFSASAIKHTAFHQNGDGGGGSGLRRVQPILDARPRASKA